MQPLSWLQFGVFLVTSYLLLNVGFATLYATGGACIGEMKPGSFQEAFFFSPRERLHRFQLHQHPICHNHVSPKPLVEALAAKGDGDRFLPFHFQPMFSQRKPDRRRRPRDSKPS